MSLNNITRQVPSNFNAEQMLLGSILINSKLFEQVNEFLMFEHFHDVLHQRIYNAMQKLSRKSITITVITIDSMLEKDELYKQTNINQKGEYLVKLTKLSIAVINAYEYGKIIYDLAIKRDLIQIGESIVNDAYDSTLDESSDSQLEQAEEKLFKLASTGVIDNGFVNLSDSIKESMTYIDRTIKNDDRVVGISTGLIDLDDKLSGFQNSDLIIIAARPAMGKTAFAINCALNACKWLAQTHSDTKPPCVGFFSLEMSSMQIASRLLSMATEIDSASLRNGNVDESHYNSLKDASIKLSGMPFFIDDTPALSISALRSRVRRLQRKHGLGIIFVDYLQLLRPAQRSENRVLEITNITQGLKAIAKEFNVPVVALSQLSRAVEQRNNKKPMLSDLRESGSIEQDADIVMFLYREEYYLKDSEPKENTEEYNKWKKDLEESKNKLEVIVAKHRNGSVGKLDLHYILSCSKISNLERVHV